MTLEYIFSGACQSYAHSIFLPDIIESNSIIFSDEAIYWNIAIKPIIDSIHSGVARLITTKPFSPTLQLKLIEQYKINVLYICTFSLSLCLKHEMIDKTDLSSVKTINFYGSKWPSSLGSTLKRYFPNTKCVSWYGMTEIGTVSYSCIDASGNIGGYRLFENRQAKIVDERGNRRGPGVNGEICVKIKSEFIGYLDDAEANAAAVDDEGFFRTGDVGHFDENAILFVEDRKKNVIDVFYYDGIILPSEIENCLLAVPDIKEVCVVGVTVASGEALPAAVVVRNSNSKLTTRDVYNVVAGAINALNLFHCGFAH